MAGRTSRLMAGTLVMLVLAAPARAEDLYSLDEIVQCGDVHDMPINDYRLRDATPANKWNVDDIGRHHYAPLMERMRVGEHSHFVMSHIDFMLLRWPNHSLAMAALIEYDLAGGLPYEFYPAVCYFIRARQFVPDDVSVPLYEGYYFWKKRDTRRARLAYEVALSIDPNSPDAHYNLGLVYVDLRDYEKAAEHARAAYAAGHPLPGLRRQLERAGYGNLLSVASVP